MALETQHWLINRRENHPDEDLRTRAGLAARAEISKVHLVKIERGERRASPAVQQSLADALGQAVADVFPIDARKTPQEIVELYLEEIRAGRDGGAEPGVSEEDFQRDMEWLGEDTDALDDWESPVVFLDEDTILIDWSRMPSELECSEAAVEHHARQVDRAKSKGRSTAIHERGLQRAELRLEAALQSVKRTRAKARTGRTRNRQPRTQRKRQRSASSSSSDDPGEPEPDSASRRSQKHFVDARATEKLERAGTADLLAVSGAARFQRVAS